MSVSDFKKYGQLIAEDEKVRAKAKEIGINDVPAQIAYAKTLGLEFTPEDVTALVKESGLMNKELSEEQLEKVAGGFVTITAALVGAVAGVVAAGVGVAGIGVQVGSEASTRW